LLAYVKLKTVNEELYETDFIAKLKEKNTKFSLLQYWICYFFYEGIVRFKYLANIITIKQIYQGYLFIFPFQVSQKKCDKNSLRNKMINKKMKKCMKKLSKVMKKYKIDTLVLSEEIKKNNLNNKIPEKLQFINYFSKNGIEINRKIHLLNGKGLIPYLIKEVVEYILEKQETNIELTDLYLCMKEIKPIYIENIEYLTPYFKTINIITPKIGPMQRIAEKIEENKNGMITVTNNKKKSLKKAKIIINFDFSEQELKKYTIYRRAIIMSMKEQEYENNGFDGIQIKQLSIDASPEIKKFFQKYHLLEECNLTTLYESIINEKQVFLNVKSQMQKDQIRVIKLYGRNGPIEEKEYIQKVS